MLVINNRYLMHIIRFDLRVYKYTENKGIIKAFNRRLHKWFKRKYHIKRIGFIWCKELEKIKHQHYH